MIHGAYGTTYSNINRNSRHYLKVAQHRKLVIYVLHTDLFTLNDSISNVKYCHLG